MLAKGTFDVKLEPQGSDGAEEASLARLSIDKSFHGDLEGTSKGTMLAASTAVEGSAGYVAIEKVSGSLGGRRGTFVLQHNGIMARGSPQLTVIVVPDSGTGELEGLEGKMSIEITKDAHLFTFDYSLPGA
jgi:hypothetical protein